MKGQSGLQYLMVFSFAILIIGIVAYALLKTVIPHIGKGDVKASVALTANEEIQIVDYNLYSSGKLEIVLASKFDVFLYYIKIGNDTIYVNKDMEAGVSYNFTFYTSLSGARGEKYDYPLVFNYKRMDSKLRKNESVRLIGYFYTFWYDDYSYRRAIYFNSSHLNYQVNITLNTANLISLGKLKSDCSDIRVIDGEREIPYYLYNCNSVSSELWIKANVSENKKLYLYYGNSGASSESNFSQVFQKSFVDSSCILELNLDEGSGSTVNDNSNFNNDGTFTFSSPGGWESSDSETWGDRNVAFDYGSYIYLDGNDYVNCGNDTSLNLGNEFTWEVWIKPTSCSSENIIWNKEYSYEWALYNSGGNCYIKWAVANSNPGWVWINTNAKVNLNEWNYVVLVYNTTHILTYVNTQLKHVRVASGDISDTSSDLLIGRRSYGNYFYGYMDDARIYKRALSEEEIKSHYWKRKLPLEIYYSLGEEETK